MLSLSLRAEAVARTLEWERTDGPEKHGWPGERVCAVTAVVSRGDDPPYPPGACTMKGKDIEHAVPASVASRLIGFDVERKRGALPALVADSLDEVLAARTAQSGRAVLDVVDVGAGTGGFAVRLAALGHQVTVV